MGRSFFSWLKIYIYIDAIDYYLRIRAATGGGQERGIVGLFPCSDTAIYKASPTILSLGNSAYGSCMFDVRKEGEKKKKRKRKKPDKNH